MKLPTKLAAEMTEGAEVVAGLPAAMAWLVGVEAGVVKATGGGGLDGGGGDAGMACSSGTT